MSKFKKIGSWGEQAKDSTVLDEPSSNQTYDNRLREVDLSRIRRGRKQYRSYTEEDHISQLMASFRENGFSGSLPVVEIKDDTEFDYEYLGGHTSGEALKRLGYTKVLVSVETVENSLALAEFSYQLNGAGRPLNALDDTSAILDILSEALSLQDDFASTDELLTLIRQIARETEKVDVSKVSCIQETWERNKFEISIKSFAASRLPLLKLDPNLKEAVKRGLSPASAIEINKVQEAPLREQLIQDAMQMSVAEIKQTVKDVKRNNPGDRRQEWQPIKVLRNMSAKAKKIDFSIIPEDKKAELNEAIQRVQQLVNQLGQF